MQKKTQRNTIKDVAKQAGVSVSTVSLALNHPERVSPDKLEVITDIASELNYRTNLSAKSLRMAKTDMIGCIVPDITNVFFSTMVNRLREYVESCGYSLLIGITGNKIINEKRYIAEFISRNVDGIIVIPMLKYSEDVSHFADLKKYNIPMVFLSAAYSRVDAPCVMCDLFKGTYMMTKYLLEKEIEDICLLVGDKRVDEDYILGFKSAMNEHGISAKDDRIYVSDSTLEDALRVSGDILNRKPKAVMTASDLMACAAVQASRTRGLLIPADISVTGFDDVLYASINQTPITTVRQPIDEMCSIALSTLLKMINGKAIIKSFEKKVVLPPQLVIRQTTP